MTSFLVAGFYFFYFAFVAILVIFFPKVLEQVGYTPVEIGIILAAAPLVRFVMPFLFLKGLKLSKNIYLASLVLLLFSTVSFLMVIESFWGTFITFIFLGIGAALCLPYVEVVALEKIGKERYGKVRLFGSIGFIVIALILAHFFFTFYSPLYYLIVINAFVLLFGVFIAFSQSKIFNETHPFTSFSFKNINHLYLWTGLLLMQVGFGPYYNFFTIYETGFGISLEETVYLWSVGVIAEILLFYFQGPLMQRNLLSLMIFATLLTSLRWLILFLYPTNTPLLYASQTIHAFSFGLFHSAAISYLYQIYANKKLSQQFFFGISYGLGAFIGSLSSGYIYEAWPHYLFLWAAIATITSTLFLMIEKRKNSFGRSLNN